MSEQRILEQRQLQEFYHQEFVDSQSAHIEALLGKRLEGANVIDVGGGAGFLAQELTAKHGANVIIWDIDDDAIALAHAKGLKAEHRDILKVDVPIETDFCLFNLVLHHLVAANNKNTEAFQSKALSNVSSNSKQIIVHEYVYESILWREFSSWFIFFLTSLGFLKGVLRAVGKIFPSLNANTAGVGVRFHSKSGWKRIFAEANLLVVNEIDGEAEYVSPLRRLLLIKKMHRTTFLLRVNQNG
ncbi:MAG: hypothetical protein NPIRA05_00090 [Nitrospirales bacterium]|nr:MAG: hypothetical protein NPIRA05_00090 [Nitrospirales bacterium]